MIELARRSIDGRTMTVVATERDDGDMHPGRVPLGLLRERQQAIGGSTWSMIDEVHGVDVVDVADDPPADCAWRATAGVGDVLVASSVGRGARRPIAVWAADCAPVVLFGRHGTIVGVHAGWRGIAAGVLDVGIDQLERRDEQVVLAVLGPVIHACCYEFGEQDLERVALGVGADAASIRACTSRGSPALDVPEAVRAGLQRRDVRLDVVGPCSGCDRRWFSHRVRADLGRHALVSWTTER